MTNIQLVKSSNHKRSSIRQSQLLYFIFLSWPMRLNFPQGFAEFLKNLIFMESRGQFFPRKLGPRDWSEESSREEDKHESHHFTLWLWSFLTRQWNYKPTHFYPIKITEKVRLCDGNATIKITQPFFYVIFVLLLVLSVSQSKQLFHICSENGNVTFSSNYKSDLSNPLSSSSSNTKIDYGFNFTVPRMAKTPTKLLLDVQHE